MSQGNTLAFPIVKKRRIFQDSPLSFPLFILEAAKNNSKCIIMLTVDKCRKLLNENPDMSDEEVEAIRERLSLLADIVLDIYPRNNIPEKDHPKYSSSDIYDSSKILLEVKNPSRH